MALVLVPTTAILVVAFSALSSGVHIRRYRTTPGRMAMGASRTIVRGAVVFTVVDLMPTGTALQVVVALYAAFIIERVAGLPAFFALIHLALGQPPRAALYRRSMFDHAMRAADVCIGTLSWCLASSDVRLLVLLAPPYAMALAAGTNNFRVVRQREHADALRELTGSLHSCTSETDVYRAAANAASMLLGTTVEVTSSEPKLREIGALLPSTRPLWLVARERFGPPSMLGRFTREEAGLIGAIAQLTASPTEAARLVAQLEAAALTDELTGLPNRRAASRRLTTEYARMDRSLDIAVLFVDIDRFKDLNSQLGHDGADAVLKEVAARVADCVRADDLVARWGGEEIVVVLTACSGIDAATETAERIRLRVRVPIHVDGREVVATVSVGVAFSPTTEATAESMLRAADVAMLQAKDAGRDQVRVAEVVAHH
jgi:diguanylate cyclase (GGDEF)-like protein